MDELTPEVCQTMDEIENELLNTPVYHRQEHEPFVQWPRGNFIFPCPNANNADFDEQLEAGHVKIDGRNVYTQQYVGKDWEPFIRQLDDAPLLEFPDKFAMQPHPWQTVGASKLRYLCQSRFGGGMCGDEMGMGKSLLAILLMELSMKDAGSFILVVCPASCKQQWKQSINDAYKQEHRPKVLVLEDGNFTGHQLYAEKYDVIIVSYHFLSNGFAKLESYRKDYRRHVSTGSPCPQRPIFALEPEFWQLLGEPAKLVIVDECQIIKNEGAMYNAIKALYYRHIVFLSGTLLSNRWPDVGNFVSLLKGHSIQTRREFIHAFAQLGTEKPDAYSYPDVVALQRFLLAIVIARPSRSLDLPGLRLVDIDFILREDDALQANGTAERFRRASMVMENESSKTTRSGMVVGRPNATVLGLAVQAQIEASHKVIASFSHAKKMARLEKEEYDTSLRQELAYVTDRHERECLETRDAWLQHLKDVDEAELGKSGRLQAVLELVKQLTKRSPQKKILIFSCFIRFLDMVALALHREHGITCMRYDGTLTSQEKDARQKAFDQSGPTIMLVTSGAGGVGLNLQCASTIIQTEIWWNENLERQVYGRCYRQGQTKVVEVFRLFATNSDIDKRMRDVQEEKTETNTAIMEPILRTIDEPLVIPVWGN